MAGMLTGLRHRLERALRRVEDQHGQLREIADALDRAVATGAPADAERWLERFTDALRSHFELEETVVFPALRGISEAVRPDLERLEVDHGRFLERLRELIEASEPGGSPTLIDALGALRERLRVHESIEEGLIERVVGAADAPTALD
jgi:iron-sulfur cluster repair protein YtfE (RIC family)